MDKEKLIKEIMKECESDGEPVTREEAEQMAEMEIKAKGTGRHYEKSSKTEKKQSVPKVRKVDEDKLQLIKLFNDCLLQSSTVENVNIFNDQREITFDLNGFNYSLVLTKHNKKK
jgi:hypothetical protein